MPSICISVANSMLLSWKGLHSWKNCQMQVCYTITTYCICQSLLIVTCISINNSIPIIRFSMTNKRLSWSTDCGFIHRQVQCDYAVTTMDGLQTIIIYARLVVSYTCIFPIVTIASRFGQIRHDTLMDGQNQCSHTITAISTLGSECIISTRGIGLTIPCITITCLYHSS